MVVCATFFLAILTIKLSQHFECREVGLFVSLSSFYDEHCIAEPDACLHVASSRRSCDRVSKVLCGSFFDTKVIFAEFFYGILTRPCDAKEVIEFVGFVFVKLEASLSCTGDSLCQQAYRKVHIALFVVAAHFSVGTVKLCFNNATEATDSHLCIEKVSS